MVVSSESEELQLFMETLTCSQPEGAFSSVISSKNVQVFAMIMNYAQNYRMIHNHITDKPKDFRIHQKAAKPCRFVHPLRLFDAIKSLILEQTNQM